LGSSGLRARPRPPGATGRGTLCPLQHRMPAPRYRCIAEKLSRPLAKAEGLDWRLNTASNTNSSPARPDQTPMRRSHPSGISGRRSGRSCTRSSRASGSCYGRHRGGHQRGVQQRLPLIAAETTSIANCTGLARCAGHRPSRGRSLRKRQTVNPLIVPARYNFLYASSRPSSAGRTHQRRSDTNLQAQVHVACRRPTPNTPTLQRHLVQDDEHIRCRDPAAGQVRHHRPGQPTLGVS